MKGSKIKEILSEEGITLSDVAKSLGYASDQRLHNALRSDDIKSGLIEAIAKATNKSVCVFYGDTISTQIEKGVAVGGNAINVTNHIDTISDKFISLLEKKDEQIDRLLTIIERK